MSVDGLAFMLRHTPNGTRSIPCQVCSRFYFTCVGRFRDRRRAALFQFQSRRREAKQVGRSQHPAFPLFLHVLTMGVLYLFLAKHCSCTSFWPNIAVVPLFGQIMPDRWGFPPEELTISCRFTRNVAVGIGHGIGPRVKLMAQPFLVFVEDVRT